MSTEIQVTRIRTARDKIRTKYVELGVGLGTDDITDLAADSDKIVNQGAVSANVEVGNSYTIPKGYHNGSGVVKGIAGEGKFLLQAKEGVVPTKSQQNITSDEGYYGLSSVTVEPIPANYQDVHSVNATAEDVLATKIIVNSKGKQITGTMPNNGTISKVLDASTTSATIAKGFHSGAGTVSIKPETKSATPSKSTQNIVPTGGKVLTKVTVNPIPENYIDTSAATATASAILVENSAYVAGKLVEGTMPNNGSTSKTMDGLTTTSVSIPAGYTTGGTISLTDDIEKALAEI